MNSTKKIISMLEIIDFEKKGNVVRFYLGENGTQWGDDWDDAPYEHNAGRVYEEYIKGHKDVVYQFDAIVEEPGDLCLNSKWSKQDMILRKIECIRVTEGNKTRYIYFGDKLSED